MTFRTRRFHFDGVTVVVSRRRVEVLTNDGTIRLEPKTVRDLADWLNLWTLQRVRDRRDGKAWVWGWP